MAKMTVKLSQSIGLCLFWILPLAAVSLSPSSAKSAPEKHRIVKLYSEPEFDRYIDVDSIQQQGSLHSFWLYFFAPKSDEPIVMLHESVDCQTREMRILRVQRPGYSPFGSEAQGSSPALKVNEKQPGPWSVFQYICTPS